MYCCNCPGVEARFTCIQCGRPLCGACADFVASVTACEDCADFVRAAAERSPTLVTAFGPVSGVSDSDGARNRRKVYLLSACGLCAVFAIGVLGAMGVLRSLSPGHIGAAAAYIGWGCAIGFATRCAVRRVDPVLALLITLIFALGLVAGHLESAHRLLRPARSAASGQWPANAAILKREWFMPGYALCLSAGLLLCYAIPRTAPRASHRLPASPSRQEQAARSPERAPHSG